ncbi:MAG TPA: hypothetical protein DCZ75_15605 [Geobacter sp.]|nr:hypothetical protein [Geobacter sp.]
MHARPLRTAAAVVAGALLAILAGCAGAQKTSSATVFFPPPPNLPRLQYLTGFSNSAEVKAEPDTMDLLSLGKKNQTRSVSIVKPAGIASRGGKLYVADISGQILVVDLPNKKMEQLKGNDGAGKAKKPVGIAVDDTGLVFVGDVMRKEVLIYDSNGEFLKAVAGDSDMTPTDVAVYGSELYVLDTRRALIKVFDPVTGAALRDIGKLPDPAQSLSLPTKMSIDGQGTIRVSNAGRGDITAYDRDGHFLSSFGKFGDGLGQFSRPKGLSADANGYIYVVDSAFQNVQVFNQAGRLLTYFGSSKLPVGGMNLPCDIAISADQLPYFQSLADKSFEVNEVIFVANQFGDPKISVYGLGKRKGVDYDKVYQQAAEERERKARERLQRMKKEGEPEEKK